MFYLKPQKLVFLSSLEENPNEFLKTISVLTLNRTQIPIESLQCLAKVFVHLLLNFFKLKTLMFFIFIRTMNLSLTRAVDSFPTAFCNYKKMN